MFDLLQPIFDLWALCLLAGAWHIATCRTRAVRHRVGVVPAVVAVRQR